jgi:hypothetical protein
MEVELGSYQYDPSKDYQLQLSLATSFVDVAVTIVIISIIV